MFLFLTVSEILSVICQYLKRSRNPEHIHSGVVYRACTSTPQCQSAHEISSASFTDFKDMLRAENFKTGHVTMNDYTH